MGLGELCCILVRVGRGTGYRRRYFLLIGYVSINDKQTFQYIKHISTLRMQNNKTNKKQREQNAKCNAIDESSQFS